jgi:hypothetical protein
MAKINYEGPEELEGSPHLFDVEFELASKQSGRAIVIAGGPEDAVSMTEKVLLDSGVSINNVDVYDVLFIDMDLNDIPERKSVVIGVMGGIIEYKHEISGLDAALTEMVDKEDFTGRE